MWCLLFLCCKYSHQGRFRLQALTKAELGGDGAGVGGTQLLSTASWVPSSGPGLWGGDFLVPFCHQRLSPQVQEQYSKCSPAPTHLYCSDWSLALTPEPRTQLTLIHCKFSDKTSLVRVLGVSCNHPEQFYAYKNTNNIQSSSNYFKQVMRYHTPSRKLGFFPLYVFRMPSILLSRDVLLFNSYMIILLLCGLITICLHSALFMDTE